MKKRTDLIKKENLKEFLESFNKELKIDIDSYYKLGLESIKYYKGSPSIRESFRKRQNLEIKWYESLEKKEPWYDVYNQLDILPDIWACWVLYSRKYLVTICSDKSLATKDHHGNWYNKKSIVEDMGEINSIVDVGCGIGYTTVALQEIFPKAKVYGTQVEGTYQFDVCTKTVANTDISIVPNVLSIEGDVDLVFASEYFEHFERPIEHLTEILKKKPKCLIIANAFNSISIGHFNIYKHKDQEFNPVQISRMFNATLKIEGYKLVKTKCWNNRPAYWKKIN